MNTNLSENSCLTVETSKAISSEISSQMSKKFEELQSSSNSQILDVLNTAIDTRVLPSIKNAVRRQNSAKNTSLDLRSDGLHQDNAAQENSQKDLRSDRLHPKNVNKTAQDAQNEFPRLISIKSNQTTHCRENSIDSQQSDDEFGYDTMSHRRTASTKNLEYPMTSFFPSNFLSSNRNPIWMTALNNFQISRDILEFHFSIFRNFY